MHPYMQLAIGKVEFLYKHDRAIQICFDLIVRLNQRLIFWCTYVHCSEQTITFKNTFVDMFH